MDANQTRALAAALSQIEKQFGKGSIMRLGESDVARDIQVVSTGSLGLDIALSVVKQHSPRMAKILEDVPLVLVEDGRLLKDRMDKVRVDEGDIMNAARQLQGLERLDQIKYAVLERNGGITIIPKN